MKRSGVVDGFSPRAPECATAGGAGLPGAMLLAVLAATAPAVALDVEKPVAKMQPCPGRPGFVRSPGGDTCTRLSGRITAGADVAAGRGGSAAVPHAVGRFAIDNRTDTDLGEVRTYLRLGNGRR